MAVSEKVARLWGQLKGVHVAPAKWHDHHLDGRQARWHDEPERHAPDCPARPDVKRTHVSKTPIERLIVKPVLPPDHPMKPNGFWYEVDGDWQRWCAGEEPGWLEGRKLYELTLDPAVRLLEIRTVAEIDAFHAEYVRPMYGSRYFMYPEWGRVAERYDGVEIAPYLWERRMAVEFIWYYGWDCASGCLWQPRDSIVTLICDQITNAC